MSNFVLRYEINKIIKKSLNILLVHFLFFTGKNTNTLHITTIKPIFNNSMCVL